MYHFRHKLKNPCFHNRLLASQRSFSMDPYMFTPALCRIRRLGIVIHSILGKKSASNLRNYLNEMWQHHIVGKGAGLSPAIDLFGFPVSKSPICLFHAVIVIMHEIYCVNKISVEIRFGWSLYFLPCLNSSRVILIHTWISISLLNWIAFLLDSSQGFRTSRRFRIVLSRLCLLRNCLLRRQCTTHR